MSDPKEILLKLRKMFPDDPDSIRAKSEAKKVEDDKMRQMFMKQHHGAKKQLENLEKARAARAAQAQYKPKTKDGTK